MSQLLNKQITIKLNRHWQAFEFLTGAQAVTFLCSEHHGERPGFAMDFETAVDENGNQALVYANPVAWEDWINLPVREHDLFITTSRGRIRYPLVVICARYDKVPERKMRWSTGNVRLRDGGVCQVTGRKLSHTEGNVGHIVARARGGLDCFSNTIWMDRRLNTLQGTRTPEEMGWKLIREPKEPKAMARVIRKGEAPVPVQTPFLID